MKFLMTDFKDLLHSLSLRATPARLAILGLLARTSKPLDIQSILEYLKRNTIQTDPATVFRIMNIFTKLGVTSQIQLFDGKTRYELVSRGDHHHLICEKCGSIQDVDHCIIPSLEEKIANTKHFQVKRHSLEFFGLCQKCQ